MIIALPIAWCLVLFLLAPLIVTAAVSFSPSAVFDLPRGELSLKWYASLWPLRSFWSSLRLSVEVATLAATLSLVFGTAAAVAITRGEFRVKSLLQSALMSPLMLPGVVIGIALLQTFKLYGVQSPYLALVLAHVVITLPYVVRIMTSSLALFDFSLLEAARTLGCSLPRAVIRVLVPCLYPSVLGAGLFAFLASFDNYSLALFLADIRHRTLPLQLLEYFEESPDPTLAAISTVLLVGTLLVLAAINRLLGFNRMAAQS